MTNDLPIDIHSSKLLDWLISRRHCNKDWQKSVLAIREKIKHAILDMPESQKIVDLLQGAYINYFHCVKIIEILRETEKDTKNFLGFYSSQRMKDWQEIESLYRKDNVFLAEAAQTLQRLAQYEIPSLKKQLTKSDQVISDAAKKFNEYGKQSQDSKKAFEKEIEKIGIPGKSLRAELLELAADLPIFFQEIAENCKELSPARAYFEEFRKYMHQESAPSTLLLPIIQMICERGLEVTTYEWKYNEKPDRVEKPNFDILLKADAKSADNDDDIDFGDEIDFGLSDETLDDGLNLNDHIDVVADDTGLIGEKIASGQDALSLIENAESQKALKLELNELLAFISTRLEDETKETGADILIRGSEKRPENIAIVKENDLIHWTQLINVILGKLNNPQKIHLLKIRGCPQYVEQLVEELEKKRDMESRYKRLQCLMTENQEKAQAAVIKTTEELKNIVDSTRTLQKQVEGEVSKKYNGRRVNLMGGINQALTGI